MMLVVQAQALQKRQRELFELKFIGFLLLLFILCLLYQIQLTQIMDFEQQLLQDTVLLAKYEFIAKIGEGCFGKIYKIKNKQLKIFTALKVQILQNQNKKPMLQNEAHILKSLRGKPYVPVFYCYGEWNLGKYIQIQLLVKDLNSLSEKTMSLDQVMILTVKLLQSLSTLHNNHIIHQDIKPQNIMINTKGEYVFIDFGISKKLKQNKRKPTQNKRLKGFIGTPRYASIQAHKGLQQSKKDDLQSLMYNIAYLYFKKLPWLSLKVTGKEKIEEIKNTKIKTSQEVFQQMGKPFLSLFDYIKRLEHLQQPNYKYLGGIFKRSHSMILDPVNKKFFQNLTASSKNPTVVRKVEKKNYSLNLGHNNGNFLQLPDLMNKMNKNQSDQISEISNSRKDAISFNNNSINNSMGGSNALSVRVYNDNDQISEGRIQLNSKQMDLSSEDNTQPSMPNISKFLNPISMKNPFISNFF